MLVKFGKIGEVLREYFVDDDNSELDDLLDMLNISLDYDDVIHLSSEPGLQITENDTDYSLEEGCTVILESVALNASEEEIIELLDGVCIDDMSTKEQKELINDLVELVRKTNWDK